MEISESLEALKACVINAVWASDIEAQFSSFQASSISDDNLLDRGIVRFCQQSAILSVAKLFDTNKQTASLVQFLEMAKEHPCEFNQVTETQINHSVTDHQKWIESKKGEIEQLRRFRDKQVAHLDESSVREHFDGEAFDLTSMRGRIRHDCTRYIQYRLAHSKMT